jgi:hypothetical protein
LCQPHSATDVSYRLLNVVDFRGLSYKDLAISSSDRKIKPLTSIMTEFPENVWVSGAVSGISYDPKFQAVVVQSVFSRSVSGAGVHGPYNGLEELVTPNHLGDKSVRPQMGCEGCRIAMNQDISGNKKQGENSLVDNQGVYQGVSELHDCFSKDKFPVVVVYHHEQSFADKLWRNHTTTPSLPDSTLTIQLSASQFDPRLASHNLLTWASDGSVLVANSVKVSLSLSFSFARFCVYESILVLGLRPKQPRIPDFP